jgi:hypothetical protein
MLSETENLHLEKSIGLLYPAYHKLYSALKSLESFEKGSDFFNNIGYLDSFFSEYRNVTFMLQKSLASTRFESDYQELRDKYLFNDTCKWFILKRNEITKQQPFDLEKKIKITVYTGGIPLAMPIYTFTIENDIEYSTLINSLRNRLLCIHPVEVFFSAEFSFYERGHPDELYGNFILGITYMKNFMKAMKGRLNENCDLSNELEKKIDAFNFSRLPKNFLFTDDYAFYCKSNKFEKASRLEMTVGTNDMKVPISNFEKMFPGSKDVFQNFILMHLVTFRMQNQLMPTVLLIYSNETMHMSSFESTIKTTTFRKLYEVAKQLEQDGIIGVYYVAEMYFYPNTKEFSEMETWERVKHMKEELLVFYMINNDLSTRSYSFDTKRINDPTYIASVFAQQQNEVRELKAFNPILLEFERILAKC